MIFLSWSCCLVNDPNLNTLWLYRDSLRFATLSQQDRNCELLGTLSYNRQSGEFIRQTLNGWPVCDNCFVSLRALSHSTWERRKSEAKEGKSHWEHASTGSGATFTEKGFHTRVWMNEFFTDLGDFQPDSGQIHLPPMDQKVIY